MLLMQNIESNPGMNPINMHPISIMTYNCNGLRDNKKLRRLTSKLRPFVNNGGIVLLQETHLTDTNYLKSIWKEKFESNCIRSNSAGVLTLFKSDFEVVKTEKDEDGRLLIVVLKNQDTQMIISNTYFPNDHKLGITFAEKAYLKILELQNDFPDYTTVAGGDYNVCLNSNDSINRSSSKSEVNLAETIRLNNKITGLVDSYRTLHKEGGYTWKRGTCYSRLDYIFISSSLIPSLHRVEQNWAYESSDHAAVQLTLKFKNICSKGPGIPKINLKILDNPNTALRIENDIKQMMDQTDDSWNPHNKLEFLKVAIRSVFSLVTSETRKNVNLDIVELEEEANQMDELKIDILTKEDVNIPKIRERLNKIDNVISHLKHKLLTQRDKLSNYLTFKSKTKWFEYGERSNKFFLNLQKSKQDRKLITNISNDGKYFEGQEDVMKGIREFYQDLYKEKPRIAEQDDTFYNNCPKLTAEQAEYLDKALTMEDLYKALQSCKDSSPGPDGIPYLVYKKIWKLAGPIILEAWVYSIKVKSLPPSHHESVITLLPKDGKDTRDIKNWRPITLSNCDAKIITKALATKLAKIVDPIIDHSQTAYVPGRAVADNLRTNFFVKSHCAEKNIDSVLISLDAKKAFDSVNHKYIVETLAAYGFGGGFVEVFKILYKNITAKILVNGFLSEAIKIERGVKQGDALSCVIFILCIDPLLRNINKSNKIKGITITHKRKNIPEVMFKGGAYADDVSVICRNERGSIQGVFDEYSKLTDRSGLELNADKTEILRLNNAEASSVCFTYNNQLLRVQTVQKLKICGLYYCNDIDEEYKLNVTDKIKKLSYQIKLWTPRNLTMEGKILIVKTFGLSQLIYNMQSYGFKETDLQNAERIIFKFIWSTSNNPNGIDRISRNIMKNEYEHGGMKVTDVECLDRSLKLRQFIRAFNSSHEISKIQKLLTNSMVIKQEYAKISEKEKICKIAQDTLNILTDHNRQLYNKLSPEEYETDRYLIDEISSIDLSSYLQRKGRVFQLFMLKQISNEGITTLGELTQSYEYEKDLNLTKIMKSILGTFPGTLLDVARCYNENINNDKDSLKYMQIAPSRRIAIESVTTKDLQKALKIARKKVEITNFENKLGFDFDTENILKFRNNCKNAKLRNIYYRLIHRDFFTYSRMKKYKMTESDLCPRCGQIETVSHLLWECANVKIVWNEYNAFMSKVGQEQELVRSYNSIYTAGNKPSTNIIKIKIIQELIQKERLTHWNSEKMEILVSDLIKMDKYIALKNHEIDTFNKKWKFVSNINNLRVLIN
jgi:exonuclease III